MENKSVDVNHISEVISQDVRKRDLKAKRNHVWQPNSRWTSEETQSLIVNYKKYGNNTDKLVEFQKGNKTRMQINSKLSKILKNSKTTKEHNEGFKLSKLEKQKLQSNRHDEILIKTKPISHWSQKERVNFYTALDKYGKNYSKIVEFVKNKTKEQCYKYIYKQSQKWTNEDRQDFPEMTKKVIKILSTHFEEVSGKKKIIVRWTHNEDLILLEALKTQGNCYAQIAANYFENKRDNDSIRARAIYLQKKLGDQVQINKKYKPKSKFTEEQLFKLKQAFIKAKGYPDKEKKESLSKELGYSQKQIQSWFGDERRRQNQKK